ncbi:DUF2960 domain-containing protein [Shewanella olleyana]|uniref:DUF2960 domain-containing protein n=1 Tax=Shewanella TaxID=22 RepID=UPI00129DABD2|nr:MULTISPECIES: DUF2960 domain-containing protein [Shewanella]MCL1067184.1 DUF2960 domain-containing protein [Shewanella olleyana]
MARQVIYIFKGKTKVIPFSYDIHHDLYEAAAEAEGIDLTRFLAMEQQVAMTSKKGAKAEKEFRKTEFARFGFSSIKFVREDDEETPTS